MGKDIRIQGFPRDISLDSVDAETAEFGTPPDYTEFESDGTMRARGDATCWRDELQPLTALRLTSPAGDFVLNATEVTVTAKNSARYPADFVLTAIQLNHDWELGSVIRPHLHWWQGQAATPNWLLSYRWQRQGQAATAGWTLVPWSSNAFTWAAGTLNQISLFGSITPPVGYGEVSDIIQFKLYRDFTNVSTEFSGGDPVAGDVEMVQFDIHLEVDTLGSRMEYTK